MRMKTGILSFCGLLTIIVAAPLFAHHGESAVSSSENAALEQILAHDRRADDKARDKFRNPGAVIRFMGIRQTDHVIEYAPGGGWYARILAPYLAEKGKYGAMVFAAQSIPQISDAFRERLKTFPARFPNEIAEWTDKRGSSVNAYVSDAIADEALGTVDHVFIPRMMHNLFRWNIADSEIKVIRGLLKIGGHVGIVQHRANDDAKFSYADGSKGYLRTDSMVKFMEVHGFRLVKQSEINANPKDTADYESGVWTLPPRLALDDVDREKYLEIGESDRMTLLFEKLP